MGKIFKGIGIIGLVIFSFFYTNKTVSVIKEQDEIMVEIRNQESNYNKEVVESIIDGDSIIPGINGLKVNINKSYNNMKKIGIFNSNYFIYDVIKPKETIKNKDKYIISGNKKLNKVSLLFIVDDINSVDKIIRILEKEKIKSDFFITNDFINKNGYLVNYLINNGYSINYYGDYRSSDFTINNTIIKNKLKQKYVYCYLENKNKEYLDICKINNNYSIIPNIIVKNNMYSKIKKEIKNGSLISIYTSDISDLNLTIKYVKSKGFDIVKLDEIFDIEHI